MIGRALFDEVVTIVSESGVSSVIGPGIVRRSLLDRKVRLEEAAPADYRAALPQLSARIAAYLPEEEAKHTVQRIEALLAHAEAEERAAHDDDDDEDISIFARVTEELRAAKIGSSDDESLRQSGERRRDGTPIAPPRRRDRSGD